MQIYWLFVQVQRVQGNQEVVCVSPSCIPIAAFAALIEYSVQLSISLLGRGVARAAWRSVAQDFQVWWWPGVHVVSTFGKGT